MKEDKNLTRAMVLLVLAQNGRGMGVEICPDPEDIAAVAEGLLPWERRHLVARHLTVCPECYRIWQEVAQAASGRRFVLRRPFHSFRTQVCVAGALAAIVCLAVFWYLHRPQEETVSRQQPASQTVVKDQESESGSSVGEGPHSPPVSGPGGLPVTVGDAANSDNLALNPDGADTRQQAARAEEDKMTASQAAGEHKTEVVKGTLADRENGSIRIGVVEMRRSTDQLTVWNNDLREMCRLPSFAPDQWNSLHARGIDILQALSESGQEEEIDRLWLMLGQMEGLTAERRKSFCAWSDKELAHKLGKNRDNARRR
jgi:hypothetical protein